MSGEFFSGLLMGVFIGFVLAALPTLSLNPDS